MSSLAQDELGHAAALYGLLGELTGTDPDALAYDREPAEYRHCRLLDHGRGDWAMTIARRFLYDTRRRGPARGARRAGRGRRWPSSSASSCARSATTGCTPGRGSTAWRASDGEPRDRLLAALAELAPDAGDGLHAARRTRPTLLDAGILDAPMAELEVAGAPRSPRSSRPSTFRCRRRRAIRTAAGSTTAPFRWLWGEFTSVRRADPGATW